MFKRTLVFIFGGLSLCACTNVVPEVSELRRQIPAPTKAKVIGLSTEKLSISKSTSPGGYRLQASVSKENTSSVSTSAGGYKLIQDPE